MSRILLAEHDAQALGRLAATLVELGHTTFAALDAAEAEEIFGLEAIELALVSLRLGPTSGLELVEQLKNWDPQVEVILLTDTDGARVAMRAGRLGVRDILQRSAPADAIRLAVANALRTRILATEVRQLREELIESLPSRMPEASPAMREVAQLVRRAAATDVTVLITGETGVGKEVTAREIVRQSTRAVGPFVTVDCGALPETLIEGELFGHEKGAFTGATARKPGRFQTADGGTLFLDEVPSLALNLQSRFLRVLETREVQRIGGTRPLRINVRFIAATNQDLVSLVGAGRFREDLYYRLAVFPIPIPPLRERRDDILRFASHFLEHASRRYRKSIHTISGPAQRLLADYSWPGNVRELRNIIDRATILANDSIDVEHLTGLGSVSSAGPAEAPGTVVPLRDAKEQASRAAAAVMIERALKRTGGDKNAAARLLGVSLKTLYNHLNAMAGGGSPRAS